MRKLAALSFMSPDGVMQAPGSGKRLFSQGTRPVGFRLIDSEVTAKGVVVANYGGESKMMTGSFAK